MNFSGGTAGIAEAFVNARCSGATLREYPGDLPTDFQTAYAIQDRAIALNGEHIGGWKVGRVAAELVTRFGADRLAGPIFRNQMVTADALQDAAMPVMSGFAAAEAELLLQLGDLPDNPISAREVPDYVTEVRFGIEIASSPFCGINQHGPAVTASDFGNNFGLVLGPVIADWRDRDLLDAPTALTIDGTQAGQGTMATMLDGPFGAAAFLIDLLRRRGIGCPSGTWVSTGAITGVHPVKAGQTVHATFDGAFEVGCSIIAHPAGSVGTGGPA
ncbi:2-keto-4-pentenoate hydratase [Novosphingobium sp.]|uniref:2-keto-4-pentenoate hydratase n=1 Tax=Novosphingobium sp. TaxID=1874826 RepID=UPI0025FD9802|nr:2-keto-4-pentenoate hydratase [Novosphingobium sp.]